MNVESSATKAPITEGPISVPENPKISTYLGAENAGDGETGGISSGNPQPGQESEGTRGAHQATDGAGGQDSGSRGESEGQGEATLKPGDVDPETGNIIRADEGEGRPDRTASEDDQFSSRFAALTRRERQLAREAAELNQMRQSADFKAFQAVNDPDLTPEQRTLKFMEAQGVDMEKIAQHLVSDSSESQVVQRLQREIDELKADRDQRRQSESESQQAEFRQQHVANIKEFVDSKGEAFELIQSTDSYDTVFEVIQGHYMNTYDPILGEGELLPFDKAAAHVERELEKQAQMFLKSKKLGVAPQASESTQPQTSAEPKPTGAQESAPTLSHSSQSGTATPPPEGGYLSRDESLRKQADFLRKALAQA